MKRVWKFGFLILVLSSIIVVGAGCNKITGGGWFIDNNTGNKITFGLNAQPLEDPLIVEMGGETYEGLYAKGQLQLIDHVTKDRIHCTFVGTADASDLVVSDFGGPATINGEGGYLVTVEIHDIGEPGLQAGDIVAIQVLNEDDPDPLNPIRSIWGFLGGGNVRVHKK